MPEISHAMRAKVWDKTSGFCWYCGVKMNPFRDFTVDHLKPISQGGRDTLANLVPCCRRCNTIKAASGVSRLRGILASGGYRYILEYRCCGKPGCRCQASGQKHGPYWYRINVFTGARQYFGKHYEPGDASEYRFYFEKQPGQNDQTPAVHFPELMRRGEGVSYERT